MKKPRVDIIEIKPAHEDEREYITNIVLIWKIKL